MTFDSEKLLDETGKRILRALQEDARISFAELGRQLGLSAPAVAERVRKMEEAGLITGYHAEIHVETPRLLAFVRIHTAATRYPHIIERARALPEVQECHHVTGADAFILKIEATSTEHLERLIAKFSPYGETTTSIVLSSPITKRQAWRDL